MAERDLRNAFAEADAAQLADAAARLAGFLADAERHRDALHVLDLALDRGAGVDIRVARASVLRALGMCEAAADDLRLVVASRRPRAPSPGTLLELAKVEWLAGDVAAAAAAMADLERVYVRSDFLQVHADDVKDWRERIAHHTPETDAGDLCDAYALLRAAPSVTARLRMLEGLAGAPAAAIIADEDRDKQRRAIAIACGDASPALRARAVQLAALVPLRDPGFWRIALQDDAPMVRGFAAAGAVDVRAADAKSLLLDALERERDDAAFGSMHRALARALQAPPPPCDPSNEAGRARALAHWRSACAQ